MIYGIGTDIIEIDRIKRALKKNPKFIEKLFTESEIEYYTRRNMNPQHIAGGFSAKEAVLKAIGTGLGPFRWRDIEIIRNEKGKPIVCLNSKIREYAEQNGIGDIHITISHCREFATATAIAEVSMESGGIMLEDLLLQTNEELGRNIH